MNTLFLIGNGFDLAHQLPTSYRSFFTFLLRKELNDIRFNSGVAENLRSDGLFELRNYDSKECEKVARLFSPDVAEEEQFTALVDLFTNDSNVTKVRWHSPFIRKLFTDLNTNRWVDIEFMYFDELRLLALRASRNLGKHNHSETVKALTIEANKLNISLDYLKRELRDYLSNEVEGKLKPVQSQEMLSVLSPPGSAEKMYLNFNYTNTIQSYGMNQNVIHIHGNIKDTYESLVFGFGDEDDPVNKTIEDLNEYEFQLNMKSFYYVRNDSYKKLSELIANREYRVFVLGHSCGLSDRTLLKEIFDTENCKQIVLFPKDISHYNTLTYDISRHFEHKKDFRRKINPHFQLCPQSNFKE